MSKKDILIYLHRGSLSPRGGPYGVGYYLHEESMKDSNSRIDFLDGSIPNGCKKNYFRWFIKFIKMFIWPQEKSEISGNYLAVHFHTTMDMYMARRTLKRYKGKVLLMSHTPMPAALERYEAIRQKVPSWIAGTGLLKLLQKMDKYAFSRADYIVFPCEDAMEPYYSLWPEFESIILKKKDKVRYITTGITPRHAEKSREVVRQELNIPEDAFVCCFVGRHNKVKGYDRLKELGERLLSQNSNMYFVICGKEDPMKGLNHERWIEVGYTTDPYSYISSSDIFILPNKETYFDLVAIEVLSLGKIIVASRTGGNKYYEKNQVVGVKLYDTLNDAYDIITKLTTLTKEERTYLEQKNQEFYFEHLTADRMYQNTLMLYKDIL